MHGESDLRSENPSRNSDHSVWNRKYSVRCLSIRTRRSPVLMSSAGGASKGYSAGSEREANSRSWNASRSAQQRVAAEMIGRFPVCSARSTSAPTSVTLPDAARCHQRRHVHRQPVPDRIARTDAVSPLMSARISCVALRIRPLRPEIARYQQEPRPGEPRRKTGRRLAGA